MSTIKRTLNKVKQTIRKYGMISLNDHVVAAVSGGPDSTALLDILNLTKDDLGITLMVAHFNHGLRPEEAPLEARFVADLAQSRGLLLETGEANKDLAAGGHSLEEKSRDARYHFLELARQKYAAQRIALGHNLNDQAETVLMRLLRGSGPSGLAGIPPCRGAQIIRPLIELKRSEIEAYLKARNLRYVTDSSNFETRHLRNRIRLELIPYLKTYQPKIINILGKTADIMRKEEAWMDLTAAKWVETETLSRDRHRIEIPLPAFRKLPEALRNQVLRNVLRRTGGDLRRVNIRHIEALDRLAWGKRPQARALLPNGLIAKRVYDKLFVTELNRIKSEGFSYLLEHPGIFYLPTLNRSVRVEESKEFDPAQLPEQSMTGLFDADLVTFPLIIRNFRPGDRFVPLGMKGHKKLKDFFIDRKIPSEFRVRIPILTCAGRIMWVCGLRIDQRFRVRPETKRVLKVRLEDD